MNLQERMVYLQSWWVASEFLRRHPDFRLFETFPGGGQYDCLAIVGPDSSDNRYIELNRSGRIHIHPEASPRFDRGAWNINFPIEWQLEQEQTDRRAVPRFLEAAMGGPVPSRTPTTTRKTLTYRMIYHLLLLAINEPNDWEVRNSAPGSSPSFSVKVPDYFADIASAGTSLVHYAKEAKQKRAFWAVLRDGLCVGLLQENATLHRPNAGPIDVMDTYNAHRRDILGTSLTIRQLLQTQD